MSQIKQPTRWPRIVVALTLFLLPLVYFFPAVLGIVTLAPGDGWTQILGLRILIGQMIANGELPLWNSYLFAGMPLLASIQPGALYPPTWLFAVLSPQTAMNVLVLTTYHLALAGTYLFARRLGCHRIASLIAAVTFSFGGYMLSHLGHSNRINAAAWLPWILLAIEGCRSENNWRWVTAGAAFIALQMFAGDPQMTFYTALMAAAYALFVLLRRIEPQRRAKFAAALAAMAICGALLSMIQLLPAREMQKLGDRAAIDYQYFSQFSFPPSQLFELFFPYFFGGAATPPYSIPYWGKWNLTETCGYVGMAAWLLAFAAIFSSRLFPSTKPHEDDTKESVDVLSSLRGSSCVFVEEAASRQIRFWMILAVVALLLCFGSFLPFGLGKLLHRLPLYGLFRASGRHLLEFDFALAMLAGFGATALTQLDRAAVRRVLMKSIGLMVAIVAVCAVAYRFLHERLKAEAPIPPNAGNWANPEFVFPMICLALSIAAVLIYARRWSALAGAVLVAVLMLDLFSFGFFYEWRLIDDKNYDVAARLADSPTVKFIKQREPDVNSFRVVSRSFDPHGANTDLLNLENISIARGLQMVNGYDPARLPQMSEVAGRMSLDGVVMELAALSAQAQGFNLLNARYLLNEHTTPSGQTVAYEGVSFDARQMDLLLEPRGQIRLDAKTSADELAIISAMENAGDVADGSPVLNVRLRTTDGRWIERQLLAGRDTDHWKSDASAAIPSWNRIGVLGRGFLARLKFDRAEIESVEFECLLPTTVNGGVMLTRASLLDSTANASLALAAVNLPPERWRKLAEFGAVELYENLKALPRAWFARQALIQPSAEVLRTIRTGRLADGQPIDLANTVLLESELFGNRQIKTPLANLPIASETTADVKITRYQPHRIELQTDNPTAGFLVLSEIYFRGWEAWVDGQRVPVERVNFTLRGVELSPGKHKIEFVFRAPSFRTGAIYSAVGALLLCVGGVIRHRKRK